MKDGGTAFPSEQGHAPDGIWNQTFDPGMSLRDWFAGQAATGILAHPQTYSDDAGVTATIKLIAKSCYQIADAMIAERDK